MNREIISDNVHAQYGTIPFKGEQSVMSGKHAGLSMKSEYVFGEQPCGVEIPDEAPKTGGFGQFMDSFTGFSNHSRRVEIGSVVATKPWVSQNTWVNHPEIGGQVNQLTSDLEPPRSYDSVPNENEIGGTDEP
jgi:hypothetical protein